MLKDIASPVLILLLQLHAEAAGPGADKRGDSFLNPTPRSEWRELSADRPDFTESPITVDAGAWQLEMSFLDYTRQDEEREYAVMPLNLKLGLRHNLDLQLVLNPYVRADAGGGSSGGLGDTELRLKLNLWGNDGGTTALGLMPFVKLPTAPDALGNGKVEGGLIVPFACDLSPRVGLGLMLEVDAVYDEEEDTYDAEWVTTAVLGFDVGERVGLYVEGIGIAPAHGGSCQGMLGLGATYALSDNAALDLGCNIGLTDETDDVNLFSGLTLRF